VQKSRGGLGHFLKQEHFLDNLFREMMQNVYIGDPGAMCRPDLSHLEFDDFCITESEKEAFNQLADITFEYMLKREASDPDKVLVDLKTYYVSLAPNIPSAEQSNMVYLPVIEGLRTRVG